MKSAMGREKYLAIALALAALSLAVILLWEWQQGLNLERDLLKMRKLPTTPVSAQNILPEFSLPAADAGFPDLLSRPLFSVNRRASASGSKGAAAMKKGQFVLVGVLITPQQKSALLRDVQTNKTETVAMTAVVRGMTLGEVEASRVVLHQGAESEELTLNVQTGPKGLSGPRPPGAPPAPSSAVAVPPAPPAPPAAASSAAAAPVRPASGPRTAVSDVAPGKPASAASGPQPPPPGAAPSAPKK